MRTCRPQPGHSAAQPRWPNPALPLTLTLPLIAPAQHQTAIIIIGRNEGERLVRCLDSAKNSQALVVYVDSASTDNSVRHAQARGATVVSLDMSIAFSAARARNAGWMRAAELLPSLNFVQFVDGDCELEPEWINRALAHLAAHPRTAAVCGRRQERHPEQSVYNLLCDLEWNTPCGATRSVGGDAMFRLSSLRRAGGYRDDVVAGEEPELCVRLRAAGEEIWRIDAPMTVHDANIHTLRAWWIRCKRGGYAYALGQHIHGAPPERHWRTEYIRALVWGALAPMLLLASLLVSPWISALIALAYPAQWLKMSLRYKKDGHAHPWLRGSLNILCKFAEAQGALKWQVEQHRGIAGRIIEYK